MKWEVTTQPATLPISYDEVYHHLRLPGHDDKAYVDDLIKDVVDAAETYMQCSLVTRTITATFYDFEYSSKLFLPRGPVASITSVTGNGVALASDQYTLKRVGNSDYLELKGSAATPVVVVYQAGYSSVPRDIRRALLMHVASLYWNRESHVSGGQHEVPFGSRGIYDLYRRTPLVG